MNPGSQPHPGRLHSLRALFATTLALTLLTACGKSTDQTTTETPPSPPSIADAAASTAAPDLSATAAAAIDTATAEAKAAELTQIVRKYAAEKQRAPKSFDELVAAGYLPSVPEAPAGKTFAIDKNLQVYLTNK